jgi:putative YphP/YqiW family bacilliredoxin
MELNMWAPMIKNMREELTRVGFAELKTADEVESTLPSAKGTTVVFVNSVCGCAGGIARPAAGMAIASGVKADNLYTVFAGQDKEATAKAREYFTGFQSSSPSIAVLKNGKLVTLIERHMIEGSNPQAVAAKLAQAVEAANV